VGGYHVEVGERNGRVVVSHEYWWMKIGNWWDAKSDFIPY
jgi:hypothetical protein